MEYGSMPEISLRDADLSQGFYTHPDQSAVFPRVPKGHRFARFQVTESYRPSFLHDGCALLHGNVYRHHPFFTRRSNSSPRVPYGPPFFLDNRPGKMVFVPFGPDSSAKDPPEHVSFRARFFRGRSGQILREHFSVPLPPCIYGRDAGRAGKPLAPLSLRIASHSREWFGRGR
jgi:hypothetical protein